MRAFVLAGVLVVFALGHWTRVEASVHRATRLGDPEHRFAPPLQKPEDLRDLLLSAALRADVEEILRQARWRGKIEDLRNAAATATIIEWPLAPGTYMPFMSSRDGGRPVALINVVWAGAEPVEAFAFEFTSNRWNYRLVAPKPCSNFYVEFVGPAVAHREIKLAYRLPQTASLCDPIGTELIVSNTGDVALTDVQVFQILPDGLRTSDGRKSIRVDVGGMAPGTQERLNVELRASRGGTFTTRVRVTAANQVEAVSSQAITVVSPAFSVTCEVPDRVKLGKPIDLCLIATNSGDAPGELTDFSLRFPDHVSVASVSDGGRPISGGVVWSGLQLSPGGTVRICCTVETNTAGTVDFLVNGQGPCSVDASSSCRTVVEGIPALLLEVVDLEDPIEVGTELIYEIRVTNQGSAPGTAVAVACRMEASQKFVSGNGTTAVEADGGSVRFGQLPVLNPGEVATWRVVVRAREPADVRFGVQLTSDQLSRPVDETEATRQY